MTTTPTATAAPVPGAARRGHHTGLALAVIVGAQLMIVLDGTIVNIALPQMQTALKFSTTDLSWVLNAYTLTFGGLLLLGGRAGDILGRRRVFIFGILLFIFASFLGGLATQSWHLLAARALQGVGGAIASPTALSLITTNFPEGKERNRAFGVFAAVSGSGAAIGLLAGGMLTSWLSWRWVLFVNVPIGVAIALLAPVFINESVRRPGQFDFSGAITSTLGMTSLVYGFIRAAHDGWVDTWTITSFVMAAVLLTSFVLIEKRHRQPVVPLRMFSNRNRSGSYVTMLLLAAAMFAMFFFMTLFVQNILGYSPLKAGFAFLPVSAVIIVSATVTSQLLLRFGPKPFMVAGAALATVGLAWLSQISHDSSYVGGMLGPMVLFAAGMGFLFVSITVTAVSDVQESDSGAASGMLNVTQQVGGSLGLSILVTVFGTASGNEAARQIPKFLASATPEMRQAFGATKQLPKLFADKVLAYGISSSFKISVVFAALALLTTIFAIKAPKDEVDVTKVPGVGS
ncbi:MAG: MFS transporter [Mycobacteriales bacterium]